MSDTATIGHNKGPIAAPIDEDVLQDLRTRFPELDEEMAQIENDLATWHNRGRSAIIDTQESEEL